VGLLRRDCSAAAAGAGKKSGSPLKMKSPNFRMTPFHKGPAQLLELQRFSIVFHSNFCPIKSRDRQSAAEQ
jgi:hypothetical protein